MKRSALPLVRACKVGCGDGGCRVAHSFAGSGWRYSTCRCDLPRFSQPLIAGVSRFWFCSEIISQQPSRLCKCGKRSLLSTFT